MQKNKHAGKTAFFNILHKNSLLKGLPQFLTYFNKITKKAA